MIKIEAIKQEIEATLATDTKGMTKRQLNKLKERLELYNLYKNYLELYPSEDFIQKEKLRISKIIDGIKNGYEVWRSGGNAPKDMDLKEIKGYYDKMINLKHFEVQLETLEYLLT